MTAAELGKEFLAKAGYPFARLEEGKYDDTKDEWRLIFQVGLIVERKKTLRVGGTTARVTAVE